MKGLTRSVETRHTADRRQLALGAFLLLVSGVGGVVAAVIRWMPCWGDPEGLACARLMSGGDAPAQVVFLLWGLADIFLLGALVFLLRGRGPRASWMLLAMCVAAGVLVTLLFGARDAAFGPWAESVVFLIWWWPIPILGFVFIIRMIHTWQSNVESAANAGTDPTAEPRTEVDAEAEEDVWSVLVMIAILVGTGLSEHLLLNTYADSVDTPYGFGGLRYALFTVVGIAMAVALLWQRIRSHMNARK